MSALKLVTDSTSEPITRLEAKTWLRLEEQETAEDPLIDSLIILARTRLEEQTARAFLVKTFDYYLDARPSDLYPIVLPKAPLVSVTSVKGFLLTEGSDSGGTAMSTSGYYVDTAREFGSVVPLSAFTYPTATRSINPVVVRFTAGYSSQTTGIPETVKLEVKQLVARLYEHRGDELEFQKALQEPTGTITELDLPTWG